MKIVSQVYRISQRELSNIPSSPLVYWISESLRVKFVSNERFASVATVKLGLSAVDVFRFNRFWWEVETSDRWYPLMKGGKFCRWYGNNDIVTNWQDNGAEAKAEVTHRYPYLKGNYKLKIRDESWLGKAGLTYTNLGGNLFSARLMPDGALFDDTGPAIFAESMDLFTLLGLVNSTPVSYLLALLNPSIHFQKGDLEKLPIPEMVRLIELPNLVKKCVYQAKVRESFLETTFDFVAPIDFKSCWDVYQQISMDLLQAEAAIDQIVSHAYELAEDDKEAISELLPDVHLPSPPTSFEVAQHWISYAMGIIMGRFQPGIEDTLGCAILENEKSEKHHLFSSDVDKDLRDLAYDVNVVVLEPNHQDDLVEKVRKALILMLNEDQMAEVIKAIGGDIHNFEDSLHRFLERDYFLKVHLKWYQNRPIYWLLQSPKKNYSVYLYHEHVTRDTLPLIRGSRYLGGKLNQTRRSIDEVHTQAKAAVGHDKKRLEKELENLSALLTDLETFDQAIQRILDMQNEYGKTVGWDREIDDSIILNLAPLYELIPSLKTELKKYWDQLVSGEYDWSYTAMHYWPSRVIEKCKTNKSYAIAHRRLDVYEGDDL